MPRLVGRQLDPISMSNESGDCIIGGYRSGLTNLISLEEFSKFKELLGAPKECTILVVGANRGFVVDCIARQCRPFSQQPSNGITNSIYFLQICNVRSRLDTLLISGDS